MNTTPQEQEAPEGAEYGLRTGAEEFPLMVVLSIIYPCNFGCPICPYTDGNSEIRTFYREHGGELFPVPLWNKIATEAGPHGAWLRCTGGGEPMLHPHMVEMIEFAKEKGCRVWLNTNSSMLGPKPQHREKLERIIRSGIDLIEFSMDAGDAETYARVRPPRGGPPRDPQQWFDEHVDNIRAALEIRKRLKAPTRVVVSIIRQEFIEGRLDEYVDFYANKVGVDEVITRKYLTWDDNTTLPHNRALDKHLYKDQATEKTEPCVWPFERMNIDTLGRVSLCGQDVSFRSSKLFPNINDLSVKEVWQGETFTWYRRMHLEGRGAEAWPCRGCSAWFAGIRDWKYGWLRVLKNSGERYQEMMKRDLGVDVELYQPKL